MRPRSHKTNLVGCESVVIRQPSVQDSSSDVCVERSGEKQSTYRVHGCSRSGTRNVLAAGIRIVFAGDTRNVIADASAPPPMYFQFPKLCVVVMRMSRHFGVAFAPLWKGRDEDEMSI